MVPSKSGDLFISYSHIDNQPWGAGQHCWVNAFHKELETRLEMLLGREARVWRDPKLNRHDDLTDRIVQELHDSRAFICILSPRYLKSEFCLLELQEFLAHDLVRSPEAGTNLFKVIKTPVDRASLPQDLQRMLGYQFFRETPAGKIHEFYPGGSEESTAFWQQIDDVAQDIARTLQAGGDAPSAPRDSRAKTIYLAETTGDMRAARDSVKRELAQHGYRVVPDRTLPWRAEELVPLIEADLREACLTVHPVGARYGFIPEGESRSIVELQIEAATAKNGHCQHVIWVPPEAVPPAEERQQQFMEKLRSVYTERVSTELLELKPVEVLKTRIAEKLEARPPAARPAAATLRVYLICERADLPAVKPVEDLLRSQGFGVSRPLLDGEEQEVLQDHRDTLLCCDAVLIYYGSARPAWLRAKQRDLWKAAGWGRTRPMLAQAVYFARPEAKDDSDDAGDELLVLKGDGPTQLVLSPFVELIRNSSGIGQ